MKNRIPSWKRIAFILLLNIVMIACSAQLIEAGADEPDNDCENNINGTVNYK